MTAPEDMPSRSDVSTDNPVPEPPFWGSKVVKGVALQEYASLLDERATFMGQWGLKSSRASDGPSYEELVESEGRPRLRMWLERIQAEKMLEAAIVYGYYPVVSEGDDLVLLDAPSIDAAERFRFTFPRQRHGRHLCLADFFRPRGRGEVDVLGLQLVTMGPRIAEVTSELFAKDAYRDYLELHGLSVQLTESLAEYWHKRMRAELGFAGEDPDEPEDYFDLRYRGARFSFGYGACPDLEDRAKIVDLLEPERIGVKLSEEFQLHPEQSTDALVAAPPRGDLLQRQVSDAAAVLPAGPLPAALLFDMDGLLVDTERTWFAVETEIMAGLGAPWGDEHQAALVGGPLEKSVQYMLDHAGRPDVAPDAAGAGTAGGHGPAPAGRAGQLAARGRTAAGAGRRCGRAVRAGLLVPAPGRGRGARRPSAPSTSP